MDRDELSKSLNSAMEELIILDEISGQLDKDTNAQVRHRQDDLLAKIKDIKSKLGSEHE
jgi:hypothetical protein